MCVCSDYSKASNLSCIRSIKTGSFVLSKVTQVLSLLKDDRTFPVSTVQIYNLTNPIVDGSYHPIMELNDCHPKVDSQFHLFLDVICLNHQKWMNVGRQQSSIFGSGTYLKWMCLCGRLQVVIRASFRGGGDLS